MSRLAILPLLAALAFAAVLPAPAARAEPALERIARTGVLSAGTREDAAPFAFRDAQGRPVGLSVDLIEEVRKALSAKLGRDIRTEFTTVAPSTRLQVVEDGRVDLVCEIATATWPREQRIDFTLPIFRDGTRILAYRDTIAQAGTLADLRIGMVTGSTTEGILRRKLPGAELTPYPSMLDALRALEKGDVDGIANVGIVLRGLLPKAEKPKGLVIVPRGEALGYEAMACIVPSNDSAWRDFVNGVLRDLFTGIEAYRGGYADIYQRWFGRDAEIAYPLDQRSAQFFADMLIWLD
ncbi:MAG: amino acid ABC transporter substrate-binding protein [Alphaproteobacteria bacterium]